MDIVKFDAVVRTTSLQQNTTRLTGNCAEFVFALSSGLVAYGDECDTPIFYEFVCQYDFTVNAVIGRYIFLTRGEERVGTLYDGHAVVPGPWMEHINYALDDLFHKIRAAGHTVSYAVPPLGANTLSYIFEEQNEPAQP